MASFNDLPDDVLWLIFRNVVIGIIYKYDSKLEYYEIPSNWINSFTWPSAEQMRVLALINKKSLLLIRKKCFKKHYGWLCIKGALTYNYFLVKGE